MDFPFAKAGVNTAEASAAAPAVFRKSLLSIVYLEPVILENRRFDRIQAVAYLVVGVDLGLGEGLGLVLACDNHHRPYCRNKN